MQEVTRNHISSDENDGNDDENAVTEEPFRHLLKHSKWWKV